MSDNCPHCRVLLHQESQFCHRCGYPLQGERPVGTAKAGGRKFLKIVLLLSILTGIIGELLALLIDIETIVVSGPIAFLLGVLLLLVGWRVRYLWALIAGAAQTFIVLFIFSLINLLRWSPGDAAGPVPIIIALYLVPAIPLYLWTWKNIPVKINPWECRDCGYLLIGLRENRCPECGLAFTPPSGPPPPEAQLLPEALPPEGTSPHADSLPRL